jgi:Tannase-like family of unknown function (DUF6351)
MRLAGIMIVAVLVAASAPSAQGAAPVKLGVLSSRADLVSGGDALVRVKLADRADRERLVVRLGKRDVSRKFRVRPNGQIEALLRRIPNRRVPLTASIPGAGARLLITGHPNGGPVFAGPQVEPWVCQKGAVDAKCNQPATYELLANSGSGFEPYDPQSSDDVPETTTTEGEKVPFIVRVETGYQDRDQYKLATLYDPAAPWKPWAPQKGWNRRLVFTHGGSCGTDRETGDAPGVLNEELLGKGFMIASTALDNLGHNCNPVIIAESEMMARERAIEGYGPVRATLGTGCSGGSIAQVMIAHAYPGFYDGITTQCTFADLLTTGKHGAAGHLLTRFFNVASLQGGELFTPLDQAAVGGSPVATGDDLVFDSAFWSNITGETGCAGLPDDVPRWSPETPDGERCGVLDHNLNVIGPGASGYAGIPLDNSGVQFGLGALEDGLLTPGKFVALNAGIGGIDETTYADVPERTTADMSALVNTYRSGYMAIGNTLSQTPFLEGRGPNESTGHVTYPALALNARLDREAGTHASHVLWQGPTPLVGSASFANRMVLAMDRWVAAIRADKRKLPKTKKIVEDKPEDITDHCEVVDGTDIPGTDCPAINRFYKSPTQVAGESVRNDILKCELKPLRREDYSASFTDAQWASLQQTFPDGVCDFSKPGVGERATVPWLTYQDAKGRVVYGGRPLGRAPRSKGISAR